MPLASPIPEPDLGFPLPFGAASRSWFLVSAVLSALRPLPAELGTVGQAFAHPDTIKSCAATFPPARSPPTLFLL